MTGRSVVTCPHCGAGLDPGPTGLDVCMSCGGVSRAGAALPSDLPFRTFDQPRMAYVPYVRAHGLIVNSALVDGEPAVGLTFVGPSGRQLRMIVVTGELAGRLPGMVAEVMAAAERTRN